MNKKIIVLISLVSSILLFSFVEANDYRDINKSYWGYNAIKYLSDIGTVQGYSDGTFLPDKSITRAEFSKIIVEFFGSNILKGSNDIEFMDVSSFHWAKEYIPIASYYLNCNTKNRFYPDAGLLRKDAAMALVNLLEKQDEKYDEEILDKFLDREYIEKEYENYIAIAVELGLLNGNTDGTFNPNGIVTRAQICQILYNIIHESQEKQNVLTTTNEEQNPEIYTDVISTNTKQKVALEENNYNLIIKPINKVTNNTGIYLELQLEGDILTEGNTYIVGPDEWINVTIKNAGNDKNYIYYSLASGNDYQTIEIKKIASSEAEISFPAELIGNKVKVTVWGTSSKNGQGYVTNTEVFYFMCSSNLNHRGEKYDTQESAKVNDRKVDFIVTFNGEKINEENIIEYAQKEQKIIIRGKPVNNVASINYRWDKEVAYTAINDSMATIEIPKSFSDGTTHKLTLTITDKQGRTYIPRSYYFIINGKNEKN